MWSFPINILLTTWTACRNKLTLTKTSLLLRAFTFKPLRGLGTGLKALLFGKEFHTGWFGSFVVSLTKLSHLLFSPKVVGNIFGFSFYPIVSFFPVVFRLFYPSLIFHFFFLLSWHIIRYFRYISAYNSVSVYANNFVCNSFTHRRVLGPPNEETWPNASKLPDYKVWCQVTGFVLCDIFLRKTN